MKQRLFLGVFIVLLLAGISFSADVPRKSGLAVVIGCNDIDQITKLADKGFIVQALDVNQLKVDKIRRFIQASGNYGRVSAALLVSPGLPYADDLVNEVVVVSDQSSPKGFDLSKEIVRVLAPNGAARFPKEFKAQISSLNTKTEGDSLVYKKSKPSGIMTKPSERKQEFFMPERKGPMLMGLAYRTFRQDKIRILDSDWPTYRRDNQRSGSTKMKIGADLKKVWETKLSAAGSQPVVMGDKLWVAEKDAHTIRCLNVKNGQDVWSFTADGRIDSAPTVDGRQILFGCRDGYVYCVNAPSGLLAWRFMAAPRDERIVSFRQPESKWPVHGSVLVKDGVVYFASGRSSLLDGGIRLYGLDVITGVVKYSHLLDGPLPDVKTKEGGPSLKAAALPDILVGDDTGIYMRQLKYDYELKRLPMKSESIENGRLCLAGTSGFLDDTRWIRNAQPKWLKMTKVRTRAMVLTGDKLIIAGPPDVIDANDPTSALEGRKGSLLQVYNTSDGKLLKEMQLDKVPVFDGIIAAAGKIFISNTDGTLVAYE